MTDPEVFGSFLLVRRLAESAMAGVYLAVRLADSSGRPLVVKRPPLGERASGRAAQAILREAEVLSEVRGAGLPALEAAGDIAGLPYVAIERLRGASLAKVLAAGGALPAPAVRAIGRDVGRALEKLHAAGWVHRDVTPSNVFVDDAGEVYLLDFGLCERIGAAGSSLVAGTRGYAAPEAPTATEARPAQDVYGLSVVLVEAALGRRLFDEASLVEAAGRGDAPPAAAALDAELPGIAAALRRDPGARPSAAELVASLAQKVAGAGEPSGSSALIEAVERAQKAAPDDAAERAQEGAPEPGGAGAVGHDAAAGSRRGGADGRLSPTIAGAPVLAATSPAPSAAMVPSPVLVERSPTPSPAVFGPPSPVLTPTASMPLVTVRDVPMRDVPAREAGVVQTMRELPGADASRASSRGRGAPVWLLFVVGIAAAVLGATFGRSSVHVNRGSSFAVQGALPKRAEVFLDGRKLTIADGVPLPVQAGQHLLAIVLPKSRRDVPFTVRPGEHVVILTAQKGAQLEEEAPP